MAPIPGETQVAARAPDLLARQGRRTLDHHSGIIPTRNARPRRQRDKPRDVLHIEWTDCGSTNGNENLVPSTVGTRDVCRCQCAQRTKFLKSDGLHESHTACVSRTSPGWLQGDLERRVQPRAATRPRPELLSRRCSLAGRSPETSPRAPHPRRRLNRVDRRSSWQHRVSQILLSNTQYSANTSSG